MSDVGYSGGLLGAGAKDAANGFMGLDANGVGNSPPKAHDLHSTAHLDALAPTGALGETFRRSQSHAIDTNLLASRRLHFCAVYLPTGTLCTNITFVAGSTGAGTPTNQWFGLWDSSRVQLRLTADDTSTVWAADTAKTLALSSTFTTTYSGLHYVSVMVKATTPPFLICASWRNSVVTGLAPIIAGVDATNTSQDTPGNAPATAAALTASSAFPYAYIS